MSASVSLIGLILFAITGFTLNHAAQIPAEPVVVERTATLPAPLLERLETFPAETTDPVPDAVARWAEGALDISIAGRTTETTGAEIYVALPRPGGDGWMTLDRQTGEAFVEVTARGPIAYLNDLHKGRDTGGAWSLFIDVFAVACLVFALTGMALLVLHARNRRMTWPLVSLGLLVPLILALIFIH
ncbi:PepSY-associated TM helix domain-containing protein [Brevundimonas sp.]|uniref:PepSY-associated TM helix domain-containing protein n=1 Tax=Brevundimonas sp. TaxID=1871086 RepID=UPI003AF8DCDF